MNYRHIYHAGGVADLFKHVVLLALLHHLARKDTGFFVLDSHAGIGFYDLHGAAAGKTGEYRQGIALLQQATPADPLLRDFIALVRAINPAEEMRFYPGSPLIIAPSLRSQDRAACCELHPDDYAQLRRVLHASLSVAIHHRASGYEAIGALLPPALKRGLILIDPPFEVDDEFEQLVAAVQVGASRFPAGSWAIWYPIKDRAAIWRFHEAMAAAIPYPQLAVELHQPETDSRTLNGSGMLLVRPPYQTEAATAPALTELRQLLGLPGSGLTYEWVRT